MALHVFVFMLLLVVCLLLLPVRLGRLDCFPRRPCSSRGGAKRSTLPRLLKPRCPDDCPACRLASTPSSGGGRASTPVRPWREVKSRRGAPKRVNTAASPVPTDRAPTAGSLMIGSTPSSEMASMAVPSVSRPFAVRLATPRSVLDATRPCIV